MDMEASSPESVGRRLREVSPAAVARGDVGDPSTSADVRHFDQLDHDQQRAFLRLLRDEPASASLPAGTVIVYTEYYRIERG